MYSNHTALALLMSDMTSEKPVKKLKLSDVFVMDKKISQVKNKTPSAKKETKQKQNGKDTRKNHGEKPKA